MKKTIREDTQEEISGVDEYREELRILLGLERVAPESSYSLGTYEQEADRVLIVKNEGKWRYGYVENNQQYLSPHEALYLIEMVRNHFARGLLESSNFNFVSFRIACELNLIL